jgi:tRNA dimethylallyltransferase
MAVNSRGVPVIVGPTASGKTSVSIRLAKILGGEIISADSRQVYRYLDVGTAKPSPGDRETIRHHFIDVIDPDADFNAGAFGEQGRAVVDGIFDRGLIPIITGGSGLYIRSLVDGFFEGPGADPEFRDSLESRLKRGELPALIEELRLVDPDSARTIDPTKPRRIVRALEVYHATGMPLSSLQSVRAVEVNFTSYFYGLLWEREALYERINRRCEQIVNDGLLREAADLRRRGYGRELNSLNTVGYKEAFDCISGEISPEEMLAMFKQNTRRYAKRQLTWFRRDARIRWITMDRGTAEGEVADVIAREFRIAAGRGSD